MRLGRMLVAAGAFVAAGCGTGTMSDTVGASTMQAYQAAGQDVSTTVATYGADTASLPDDAACVAAHDAYATRMPVMLERMRETSAAMDRHMADYGYGVPADMACVAEVMAAEFERHHAEACAAPDVPADDAEAAQHVAAMTSLVEHQRIRYEGAGSMMGMMDGPAGTTWTCEKNADGTFTIDGQTWTPGTPLPGADEGDPQPWPMPCSGGSCSGCDGSGGMGGGGMM